MTTVEVLENFLKYRNNEAFRRFISRAKLSDDELIIRVLGYSPECRAEVAMWVPYVPTGDYKRATYWPALGVYVADLSDDDKAGIQLPHFNGYIDKNAATMWRFSVIDAAAGTYIKHRQPNVVYKRDLSVNMTQAYIAYTQVDNLNNSTKWYFSVRHHIAELTAEICSEDGTVHCKTYSGGKPHSQWIKNTKTSTKQYMDAAGNLTAIIQNNKFTLIKINGVECKLDDAAGENVANTLCYKVGKSTYKFNTSTHTWRPIKLVEYV